MSKLSQAEEVDGELIIEYGASGHRVDQPSKMHACKAWSSLIGGFLYMIFPGSSYVIGVM